MGACLAEHEAGGTDDVTCSDYAGAGAEPMGSWFAVPPGVAEVVVSPAWK